MKSISLDNLTRFWNNIKDKFQPKLTAGLGIHIDNNEISSESLTLGYLYDNEVEEGEDPFYEHSQNPQVYKILEQLVDTFDDEHSYHCAALLHMIEGGGKDRIYNGTVTKVDRITTTSGHLGLKLQISFTDIPESKNLMIEVIYDAEDETSSVEKFESQNIQKQLVPGEGLLLRNDNEISTMILEYSATAADDLVVTQSDAQKANNAPIYAKLRAGTASLSNIQINNGLANTKIDNVEYAGTVLRINGIVRQSFAIARNIEFYNLTLFIDSSDNLTVGRLTPIVMENVLHYNLLYIVDHHELQESDGQREINKVLINKLVNNTMSEVHVAFDNLDEKVVMRLNHFTVDTANTEIVLNFSSQYLNDGDYVAYLKYNYNTYTIVQSWFRYFKTAISAGVGIDITEGVISAKGLTHIIPSDLIDLAMQGQTVDVTGYFQVNRAPSSNDIIKVTYDSGDFFQELAMTTYYIERDGDDNITVQELYFGPIWDMIHIVVGDGESMMDYQPAQPVNSMISKSRLLRK